jgi:hypothetical protein
LVVKFAMATPRRNVAAVGLALSLLADEHVAAAQIHWDASAELGVMKRFLGARPPGSSDAGVGIAGQINGHVALLPLVYVGAYVGHDISPLPGDASPRDITSGGVRAKGVLPWGHAARAWVFAGFGYAGVYARSYHTTFAIAHPTGVERQPVLVEGASGSFFEVPFGLGASYKLSKPWELCAELGASVGFGHKGSAYEEPGPSVTVPNFASQNAAPAGLDRLAVGLTLGVLLGL